jgi:hypothetical protein
VVVLVVESKRRPRIPLTRKSLDGAEAGRAGGRIGKCFTKGVGLPEVESPEEEFDHDETNVFCGCCRGSRLIDGHGRNLD